MTAGTMGAAIEVAGARSSRGRPGEFRRFFEAGDERR
jgi:hypothetical protein